MNFSITAFLVTAGAIIISGAISFWEGTLTNKRVKMGFLNHGGMWGDLIILPTVTGLTLPYFVRSWVVVLSALFIALMVTDAAHVQWAKWFRTNAITGHIFPTHEIGKWHLDISKAGWMHVFVMALLLAAVLIYSVSPLPVKTVVTVSLLLTTHAFLATIQPGWYCTGQLWTWRNFGPAMLTAALIWTIAALKIQLAREIL